MQFEVTPGFVRDMAARLLGIRNEIDSPTYKGTAPGDAMGPAPAPEALQSFDAHWVRRKTSLVDQLEQLATKLDLAANAYDATERSTSDGFATS